MVTSCRHFCQLRKVLNASWVNDCGMEGTSNRVREWSKIGKRQVIKLLPVAQWKAQSQGCMLFVQGLSLRRPNTGKSCALDIGSHIPNVLSSNQICATEASQTGKKSLVCTDVQATPGQTVHCKRGDFPNGGREAVGSRRHVFRD